jgi:hypothetical protein
MDPLTVIVTAVATGAAVGLKDVAGAAIKDTYVGFKALILRKYGRKGLVKQCIQNIENDPKSQPRQAMLKEELAKTQATQDQELLETAKGLLEAAKPADPQQGQQSISITGSNNTITQVSQQAGDNAFQLGGARDVSTS